MEMFTTGFFFGAGFAAAAWIVTLLVSALLDVLGG